MLRSEGVGRNLLGLKGVGYARLNPKHGWGLKPLLAWAGLRRAIE